MVECRFHAPQPITGPINDNFDRITYPPLQAHDYWCGQWKTKEFKFDDRAAFDDIQRETWMGLGRNYSGDQAQPQKPAPQEQVVTYDSLEDLAA
jgi:hypothetical protein